MKRPQFDTAWPESWKQSFFYDRMEVFDEIPPGEHGYVYSYQARAENTLDLIRQAVRPGARILDVAAAQGNFTLRLAEAGFEVTWNDLRADLADYVRAKWEHGTVHYRPGNVFDMGADSGQFDAVLIAEVIEHVAHPDQFLRRVSELVKPDGVIVLTTPNGGYFRNRLPRFSDCSDPARFESQQFKPNADGHIFLLHEDEVRRLANEAGLVVTRLDTFANPLMQGHLKSRLLLPLLPRRLVDAAERLTRPLPTRARSKIHTHLAALLRRSPVSPDPTQGPQTESSKTSRGM